MYLFYEEHALLSRLQLADDPRQPLLELPAILRTRDQSTHVQREHAPILKGVRDRTVDDRRRELLYYRSLANSGVTNQHRIVLRATREYLDNSLQLVVSTYHRIQLAFACHLRQVHCHVV